jgi:hypothetical protein
MSQNTWTAFGPDAPLSALPLAFRACLPPNSSTEQCDELIGSAQDGQGFCADPNYRQMTYCACVNNSVACPEYAMASCANSAYSYKPWAWYQPGPDGAPSKDQNCASAPICVNLMEVGGSQNVVSDITQQCGTITNITNVLKTNPKLAALTFLLFIILVVVMSMRTADSDDKSLKDLPPPPSSLFGDAAAPPPF